MNAPNNTAKVTNQRGAIPISLLNSHFHSSIGTSHSKTCITLPPLPVTAEHDNPGQHIQHTLPLPHWIAGSITDAYLCKHTQTGSSMSRSSGDEGLSEFTVTDKDSLHILPLWKIKVTSSRHTQSRNAHRETHTSWHPVSLISAHIHLCRHSLCVSSESVALTLARVKVITKKQEQHS